MNSELRDVWGWLNLREKLFRVCFLFFFFASPTYFLSFFRFLGSPRFGRLLQEGEDFSCAAGFDYGFVRGEALRSFLRVRAQCNRQPKRPWRGVG